MKTSSKIRAGVIVSLAALSLGVAIAQIPKNYTPGAYATMRVTDKGSGRDVPIRYLSEHSGACAGQKPTASGFGTNATITSEEDCAYAVNVGTASINGTIILPVAADGWVCSAQDLTTYSGATFLTRQISSTTNTAVIEDTNTAGAAGNWTANDVVAGVCHPY